MSNLDDADIIVQVRGGVVVDVTSKKVLRLMVVVKDHDNEAIGERSEQVYEL